MERTQNNPAAKLIRDPRILSGLATTTLFFLGWNLIPQHTLPDYPPGQLLPFLIMGITALLMAGTAWLNQDKEHLYLRLTHLFSLGLGLSVVAIWGKLEFGPGGVVGDSWFNTSIITKYKHSWGNTDYVYEGLHSFYPPLYHFLLGKLAWLTGREPYTMLNVGMTLTAFFLPWGIFAMWKRVVNERLAFLFVLISILAARDDMLYKPYEVISITLFIPWMLRYFELGRGKMTNRNLLWGGLIGAGMFMTYYYYFFLLIPFLPLRSWVDWRMNKSREQLGEVWRGHLRLFGWMALFSTPFWLPLLYDFLRYGVQSFQNRWFQPYMIAGPYGTQEDWLIVVGLLLVVLLAVRKKLAQGLVLLLLAQMIWLLLGYIGMLMDTPLLHMRIFGLTEYLAWMGIAMGLLMAADQIQGPEKKQIRVHLPAALAVLICFYMADSLHQDRKESMYKIASKSEMPALAWFPEFRKKAKDKVFLTNRYELSAYRPLYYFICHNAHFSHPASRFRERLKLLALLTQSKNSSFVSAMLRHNKYVPVDYLVLDDAEMKIYDDNFPDWNAHTEVMIKFDPEILQGAEFLQDSEFPEMIKVLEPKVNPADWLPAERAVASILGDEDAFSGVDLKPEAGKLDLLRTEMGKRVKDYRRWARELWKKLNH